MDSRDRIQQNETLSVPKTLSLYATWAYSWIRPPSLSRRRTRVLVTAENGQLVTQDEDLGVLDAVGAGEHGKPAEQRSIAR
jgi:hypothetical protein